MPSEVLLSLKRRYHIITIAVLPTLEENGDNITQTLFAFLLSSLSILFVSFFLFRKGRALHHWEIYSLIWTYVKIKIISFKIQRMYRMYKVLHKEPSLLNELNVVKNGYSDSAMRDLLFRLTSIFCKRNKISKRSSSPQKERFNVTFFPDHQKRDQKA